MGTALREIETHTAKSCCGTVVVVFFLFLGSHLKRDHPPPNKMDVSHLTFTRLSPIS